MPKSQLKSNARDYAGAQGVFVSLRTKGTFKSTSALLRARRWRTLTSRHPARTMGHGSSARLTNTCTSKLSKRLSVLPHHTAWENPPGPPLLKPGDAGPAHSHHSAGEQSQGKSSSVVSQENGDKTSQLEF